MNSQKNHNDLFIKDFIWYFLGSFVPLFIGFIKTPIFTRYFSKADYGYLGIVGVTFAYFGIVLFSWIGSCLWRYYAKYKVNKSLVKLYSNLLYLYFWSFVVLLIISMTWYFFAESLLTKRLILFSFFQILFNQLLLNYLVLIRLEGRSRFYTVFQTIRAILTVGLSLLLVFVLKTDITALVLSLVLIDLLALLYLAFINPSKVKFRVKHVDKKNLMELINYGSMGLILNLAFLLISTSDRYIIYLFGNLEWVGIYDQVYKLSQIFIASLIAIYFNTINPTLLNELEHHYDKSISLIQKYIQAFIVYGLPVVIYAGLFSKEISILFLGAEFREGYSIISFIFIGIYLQGLSNFYELRMKFANKLKKLSLIAISAATLNIVLNFIFVGLYGYKWAAITTVITYLMLVINLNLSDRKLISFFKLQLIRIIMFLALQMVIYYSVIQFYDLNIIAKIIFVFIFISTYFWAFKKQFNQIIIPINNHRNEN